MAPIIDLRKRPRAEGPLTFSPEVEVEQADPFEALERAAGAIKPSRIQEALELEEGRPDKPQKCKYCAEPATHSLIHAEGAAYVAICDDHDGKARDAIGDPLDIVGERKIEEGSFEEESARILERSKSAQARRRHKFDPARWTHPNGHPRCKACGGEEPIGGYCNSTTTDAKVKTDLGEADANDWYLFADPSAVEEWEHLCATLVQEGAYWDPEKHPRWPKGTPLAGKFMDVGQRFELNGKEYDITSVMPGKLHANVATKGNASEAKSVSFTTAQLEAATRPSAEPIKAATKQATSSSATGGKAGTATVLDPYVDTSSHDASIPIPEAAKGHISPEAWKRFGQLDQERYSQLMERFGSWSPGKSGSLVQKALGAASDATAKQAVVNAYASQKGSSTGLTIGLHQIYGKVADAVSGGAHSEKKRGEFEKARQLQGELASAMQWDLYNRTRAPDVSLFHKHSDQGKFDEIVGGKRPVFSGLSMSQHYRHGWWSNGCFAVPMAIRHVVMSTVSGNVTSGYEGEQEVATADPYTVKPGKAMNWNDSSFASGKAKWLESQTHQAGSGEILEMLQKAQTDPSFELPIPPSPPIIQLDKQGGNTWKEPPAAATTLWKKWGTKVNDQGVEVPAIEWFKPDKNGDPIPKEANQLRLKPGDYIQGNPKSSDTGTLYVIVEDHADSYMGLAYYKLTEGNGITPAAGGQAFHFEGGGTTKFKKIDAHFDIAAAEKASTEASGKKTFNPGAWSEGVDKTFVSKLPEGAKFNVHGVAYEVMPGVAPGASQVKVKQLDTGELGKINGDYKTPTLQLKPGFTEEGTEEFDQSDYFTGEKGLLGQEGLADGDIVLVSGTHHKVSDVTGGGSHATLTQIDGNAIGSVTKDVPLGALVGTKLTPKPLGWTEPQIGDTLAIDGKKAKVTKILKTGEVQINLSPGVMKVKPDDPILAGVFSPANHELGEKVKLKTLEPGAKFHAGSGTALRPYMVVKQDGKQTVVQNLDTGEESTVGSTKSFKQLVPKAAQALAAPELPHVTPGPAGGHDPTAWEYSHTAKITDLHEGDVISKNDVHYLVSSVEGNGEATNLQDGTKLGLELTSSQDVSVWKPAGSESPSVLGDLEPGDHFVHNGAVYKLTSASIFHTTGVGVLSGQEIVLSKGTLAQKVPSPTGSEPAAPAGTTPYNSIAHGAKFQAPGADGEPQGPVFEKLSADKVLNTATGDEMSIEPSSTQPYHVVSAATKKLVFGNGLQNGDVFTHEGLDWKVVAQAAPGAEKFKAAPLAHPATEMEFDTGGAYEKHLLAQPPGEPESAHAPDVPSALPATAYDPSAYVPGGEKKLGDLAVGDVFVGATNGKHYMVTKTGAKSGLSALDLMTGKVSAPWGYEKKAQAMHSKAAGGVAPYEELTPGDPVQIGSLKPGDHVQLSPEGTAQVYEIVAKGEGEAPQMTVAPVNADYTLGQPGVAGTHPLAVVTFHAHSGDVAAKKAQLAQAIDAGKVAPVGKEADPSHYPDAATAGLSPFSVKSKTGGGYYFTKAKLAGEGTILQDKSGQLWKVEVPGAYPIVTDGHSHFHVDGDHNLKIANDQPFADMSPPLHGASVQDTAAEVAHATETPAAKPMTLGDADLEVGHTFTTAVSSGKYSGTWEVLGTDEQNFTTAVNLKTGKVQTFGSLYQVTSVGKDSFSGYSPGDDVVPSKLKVGDHISTEGGKTYKVVSHTPDVGGMFGSSASIALQDTKSGQTFPAYTAWDDPHITNPTWKFAAPPKPGVYDQFDPAVFQVGWDSKDSAHLEAGDVFATPGTQTPYKVVADLGHVVQVIDGKGGKSQWSKQAGPVLMMEPAGTAGGLPSPEDMPKFDGFLASVPVGSLISAGGEGDVIWKVMSKNEAGGIANVQLVKPSATAPYEAVGQETSFPLSMTPGAVMRPEGVPSPPPVEKTPEFAPNSKFADGVNWKENTDGVPAGSLPIGTHVLATGGTVFKITGSLDPDKVGLTVVADPHPGDAFHSTLMPDVGGFLTASTQWVPPHFDGDADIYPSPKAASYTDAGKTTVEALQPGDYFKSVAGKVFQVVSHSSTPGGPTTVKGVTHGEVLETHAITAVTKVTPDGSDPATHGAPPGLAELHGLVPNEKGLNVSQLWPGAKFATENGVVHELTYDPEDSAGGEGMAAILAHPTEPGLVGAEDWVDGSLVPTHVEQDGPTSLPDSGSAIESLPVGTRFEHDGLTYEVTANEDGAVTLQDDMGNSFDIEGDEDEFQFGLDTQVKVLAPASSSGTALELPPNTQGQPIGSLSIGDHIQTEGGSIFQVTAKPPSGIIGVKAISLAVGDPVAGTDDFGPTYVPAAIHAGNLPSPQGLQPGDTVTSDTVAVGMHFTSGTGTSYRVLAKTNDGLGTLLKLKVMNGPEAGQVIEDHYEIDDSSADYSTWTVTDPGDIAQTGGHAGTVEDEQPAPQPSPLNAYSPKSQTGGGYFFGVLGAIPEGTKFTDKTGAVYEKVGGAGGQHVFKDLEGTHYAADGTQKVKLLDGPGASKVSTPDYAAAALADLEAVPVQDQGLYDSPYNVAGDLIGKSLSQVKPGEKFTGQDGTYELLGHKGGWSVYRRVIEDPEQGTLGYGPVKVKPHGVYVRPRP